MSFSKNYLSPTQDVKGFFLPAAATAFNLLLEYQKESSIGGNLLEIGVWHGKSASLLAMHTEADETFFMVDAIARTLEPEIRATFDKVGLSLDDNRFRLVECYSRDLNAHVTPAVGDDRYRCIHIDGLHDARTVYNDIAIADGLCAENGIVLLDDFFSSAFPAVTEAFYQYAADHPYSFKLFLVGCRKGFLARPDFADAYRRIIIRRLIDRLETEGLIMTLHKHSSDLDSFAIGLENRGRLTTPFHGEFKADLERIAAEAG